MENTTSILNVKYDLYKNERYMVISGVEGTFAVKVINTKTGRMELPINDAEKEYFKNSYINFRDENELPPAYRQKIEEEHRKIEALKVKLKKENEEYDSKAQYGYIRVAALFVALGIFAIIIRNGILSVIDIGSSFEIEAKAFFAKALPFFTGLMFLFSISFMLAFLVNLAKKQARLSTRIVDIQNRRISSNSADELIKYTQLLEKNLITQEEFEQFKKRMLDSGRV